ncbi:hypothetical protein JW796_04550 [Candidatus Dojkabacteria bacterium]|nr:hypothetical protein [Candidatus Dojkabacteria bacterium]
MPLGKGEQLSSSGDLSIPVELSEGTVITPDITPERTSTPRILSHIMGAIVKGVSYIPGDRLQTGDVLNEKGEKECREAYVRTRLVNDHGQCRATVAFSPNIFIDNAFVVVNFDRVFDFVLKNCDPDKVLLSVSNPNVADVSFEVVDSNKYCHNSNCRCTDRGMLGSDGKIVPSISLAEIMDTAKQSGHGISTLQLWLKDIGNRETDEKLEKVQLTITVVE